MTTTTTARTKNYLAKYRQAPCALVERWIPHAKRRIDLFGFADLVALDGGIVAIQATTASNLAARVAKIRKNPLARRWLESGGKIEVWGWKVVRQSGRVKWVPVIRHIALDDMLC